MKIGMMSSWNATCGASVHAELIGRVWIERGHKLTVFAPLEKCRTKEKDEPWVVRNYGMRRNIPEEKPVPFDPHPFIDRDYEVFVHQNIPPMPVKELFSIAPKIKEKAKTVLVIHEGRPPINPRLYRFGWDVIVCFDERYKKFLTSVFPVEKIHIISYPCHPIRQGDKSEARKRLNLPLDKKILFTYGIGVHQYLHLLPTLERLQSRSPFIFLIATEHKDWFDLFETLKRRYSFIELRRETPTVERLYTYLHASDILIFHKDSSQDVVVSSMVYMCLGSGCPIITHATNFVETLDREVIKYSDLNELSEKISAILEGSGEDKESLEAAKEYVKKNTSYEIGERFIRLFKSIGTSMEPRIRQI